MSNGTTLDVNAKLYWTVQYGSSVPLGQTSQGKALKDMKARLEKQAAERLKQQQIDACYQQRRRQ